MTINGFLPHLPAVILGRLVDFITPLKHLSFNRVLPYLWLIIIAILIREILTVIRKYLIENIATQTEKTQTVEIIDSLLKTDNNELNSQQIGSLHGKVFRSIQG